MEALVKNLKHQNGTILCNRSARESKFKTSPEKYVDFATKIIAEHSEIETHDLVIARRHNAFFTRVIFDFDDSDKEKSKPGAYMDYMILVEKVVRQLFIEKLCGWNIESPIYFSCGSNGGFHVYTNVFTDFLTMSFLHTELDDALENIRHDTVKLDRQIAMCSCLMARKHNNIYNHHLEICKPSLQLDPLIFRTGKDLIFAYQLLDENKDKVRQTQERWMRLLNNNESDNEDVSAYRINGHSMFSSDFDKLYQLDPDEQLIIEQPPNKRNVNKALAVRVTEVIVDNNNEQQTQKTEGNIIYIYTPNTEDADSDIENEDNHNTLDSSVFYERYLYAVPRNWPVNLCGITSNQLSENIQQVEMLPKQAQLENYYHDLNDRARAILQAAASRSTEQNTTPGICEGDDYMRTTCRLDNMILLQPDIKEAMYKKLVKDVMLSLVPNNQLLTISISDCLLLIVSHTTGNSSTMKRTDLFEYIVKAAFKLRDVTTVLSICCRSAPDIEWDIICQLLLNIPGMQEIPFAVEVLHRWESLVVAQSNGHHVQRNKILKTVRSHLLNNYYNTNFLYTTCLNWAYTNNKIYNISNHPYLTHADLLELYNHVPDLGSDFTIFGSVEILNAMRDGHQLVEFRNGNYEIVDEKFKKDNDVYVKMQYRPSSQLQMCYRLGDRIFNPFLNIYELNSPSLNSKVHLRVPTFLNNQYLKYATNAPVTQKRMYKAFQYMWPFARMIHYQRLYINLITPFSPLPKCHGHSDVNAENNANIKRPLEDPDVVGNAAKRQRNSVKRQRLLHKTEKYTPLVDCNYYNLDAADLNMISSNLFHPHIFNKLQTNYDKYVFVKHFVHFHLLVVMISHQYAIPFNAPNEFLNILFGPHQTFTGRKRQLDTQNDSDRMSIQTEKNSINVVAGHSGNNIQQKHLNNQIAKIINELNHSDVLLNDETLVQHADNEQNDDNLPEVLFKIGNGQKKINFALSERLLSYFVSSKHSTYTAVLDNETIWQRYINSTEFANEICALSEQSNHVNLSTVFTRRLTPIEFSLIVFSVILRGEHNSVVFCAAEDTSWAHRMHMQQKEIFQSFEDYLKTEVFEAAPLVIKTFDDYVVLFEEFTKGQNVDDFDDYIQHDAGYPFELTTQTNRVDDYISISSISSGLIALLTMCEFNPDQLLIVLSHLIGAFYGRNRFRQNLFLLGPSGSGKSVLLDVLTQLTTTNTTQLLNQSQIFPQEGTAFWSGFESMVRNVYVAVQEMEHLTMRNQQAWKLIADAKDTTTTKKYANENSTGLLTASVAVASDQMPKLNLSMAACNRILPVFKSNVFCEQTPHDNERLEYLKRHTHRERRVQVSYGQTVEPYLGVMLNTNKFLRVSAESEYTSRLEDIYLLIKFLFIPLMNTGQFTKPVNILRTSYLRQQTQFLELNTVALQKFQNDFVIYELGIDDAPQKLSQVMDIVKLWCRENDVTEMGAAEIRTFIYKYVYANKPDKVHLKIIRKKM